MAASRDATSELIRSLARDSGQRLQIPQVLSTILDSQYYKDSIQHLSEQDLGTWVKRLGEIIDSDICTEQLRTRLLRSLREICESMGVPPPSHYFHGGLSKTDDQQVYRGTTDVRRVADNQKQIFAARILRANHRDDRDIKRYYSEITVWKQLNHPNLVPILGVGPDIAKLCAVSPWMPDGNLLQYLKKYPGASRVPIMIGVVDGLSHLHNSGVIHGDLKGQNILFDNAGIPRISDFGIFSITLDFTSNNNSTPLNGYDIRWTAPEILKAPLNSETGRPTKMSDVYAFAMVAIEIFTGKRPFPDDSDEIVKRRVMEGKRPPKPTEASKLGLSSAAWKIITDCWKKKQSARPDIWDVGSRLRK